MRIAIATGPVPTEGAAVVLVGHDGTLSRAAATLDEQSHGLIRRALDAAGSKAGKHGHVIDLFLPAGLANDRLIIIVGGKDGGPSRLELEELGGTLAQKLLALKVARASVGSPAGINLGHSEDEIVARMALGARLRAYRFNKYKRPQPDDDDTELTELTFLVDEGTRERAEAALAGVQPMIDAIASTRDLVSEPANILYPETFADAARELANLGVEVEVLDKAKLQELGMRALLGVAQGSVRDPYVVVMRWRGAEGGQPVAFIGKGVCFDTGGISIKPAAGMESMKWDMAGAAAVYGAIKALAGRKAKADVIGVVGLVENMPSGSAQRPGDVVTAMSGKTIEVINTDAEGRLLLADVLWYTQDRFKPRIMVDLATLTGAIIVALGHESAGLFASDDELAKQLLDAGAKVGENLWRMPLGKAYEKHIKSDIAEIKNVGRNREAGATAGAVFLQQFVNNVPWAHLDIAGTAWTSKDLPLAGKGATAFGVRLLDQLVADACEQG